MSNNLTQQEEIDAILEKLCVYFGYPKNERRDDEELTFQETRTTLTQMLIKAQEDTAKAYGGCTNCYGKGYSTTIEFAQSFPDFIGDKGYKSQKPMMKYCDCERGKQLQSLRKETT